MLTPDELRAMLADLESDRIERTSSTNNTDKFAQAVCAFANDLPHHSLPGYLIIGVDDSGTPTGLQVTDQLLQNLGGLRSDGNIRPLPVIAVFRVRHVGHGRTTAARLAGGLRTVRPIDAGSCIASQRSQRETFGPPEARTH